MEPFSSITNKDIIYFVNYYHLNNSGNIYLTAWNFILQNKDILVPISIYNYLLDFNLH